MENVISTSNLTNDTIKELSQGLQEWRSVSAELYDSIVEIEYLLNCGYINGAYKVASLAKIKWQDNNLK